MRPGNLTDETRDGVVLESSVEGGALWLGHNVVAQITMGPSSGEEHFQVIEIAVFWLTKKDLLLGMTRHYSAKGDLLRVTSSTWTRAR